MLTVLRKAFLRGGSPYYYARKYLEIATTLPEFVARKRLAAGHRAKATQDDLSVVDALNRHGDIVLDRSLDLTDELVSVCNDRLRAHKAIESGPSTLPNSKTKFFWNSLLSHDDLQSDSVFVRYALQERLVRWASIYLGEAAYLSNVSLQYSFEVRSAGPTHSQLWHKDFDATRIFKVFVYCSHVLDEEDGPLHVADRRAMRGFRATPLFSTFRYTDEQFFKMARPDMTRAICGPSGTTFICDTQKSFHYGSRCHKPRLACWFTCMSYAGLYPAEETNAVSDSPFSYVLSRRIGR